MIYLLPLFLIIIGFKVYDRPYFQKNGTTLWFFVFISLVLIIGLRYKVGGDTYNYMTYFAWSPELTYWEPFDASGFEPGFSLLTSAIKTLSDNLYVYQTIISFLQTFMLMVFIRRNTPYKFLALLLLYVSMYLYFSTEVVREALAIGGLLLAYPLLEKKKYVRYYIVCLLLLTLHSSAIICFFLPLLRNLKLDMKFIIYIFLFIVLGFGMATVMQRLGSYFIFQKLLRYFEYSNVGYAWSGLRFIYFSILPLWFLYLSKKRLRVNVKYENIICFQILMGIGLWFVPIVFQRLINYTIVFYLVSLAHVTGTCLRDTQYRRMISVNAYKSRCQFVNMLLVCTILAHSSYYVHLNFYERYIPYHSVFDPVDVPEREKYVAGQD